MSDIAETGSIADWMYRYMCGFRPDVDKDIKMMIKPMPDKRFSYVKGKWESVFGTYVCNWNYNAQTGFQYDIEVPFNANAEIVFPNGKRFLLECGTYHFDNNGESL